jgi:hypothetical protein
MSAVTPEQFRGFYRAVAHFYRKAPWRSVAEREIIRVECLQLEGSFWFAVVLGNMGKIKELWLCDALKTCFLFGQGDYKAVAEHPQYTAHHFGTRRAINRKDLERAQRLSFEVASSREYPAVLRKERGSDSRSSDTGELELLEACLCVIPDFVKRVRDPSPDVLEYSLRARAASRRWTCHGCQRSG